MTAYPTLCIKQIVDLLDGVQEHCILKGEYGLK